MKTMKEQLCELVPHLANIPVSEKYNDTNAKTRNASRLRNSKNNVASNNVDAMVCAHPYKNKDWKNNVVDSFVKCAIAQKSVNLLFNVISDLGLKFSKIERKEIRSLYRDALANEYIDIVSLEKILDKVDVVKAKLLNKNALKRRERKLRRKTKTKELPVQNRRREPSSSTPEELALIKKISADSTKEKASTYFNESTFAKILESRKAKTNVTVKKDAPSIQEKRVLVSPKDAQNKALNDADLRDLRTRPQIGLGVESKLNLPRVRSEDVNIDSKTKSNQKNRFEKSILYTAGWSLKDS